MKIWKALMVLALVAGFSLGACSKSAECKKKCAEAVEQAKKQAGGNEQVIKAAEEALKQCEEQCDKM